MVEDFIHTDALLGLSDPCKTNFIMFQQGAPVLSLKTSLVASASQIPVSDFKVLDKDILIKNQFWAKISILNHITECVEHLSSETVKAINKDIERLALDYHLILF